MARARHGTLLLDTTGGADPDYVIWAKEIAGITRAWTFRHYKGTGTVGVMVATSNPVNPAPATISLRLYVTIFCRWHLLLAADSCFRCH